MPERSYELELLDGEGHSYEDIARMLREIARVNRWLGGMAAVRRPLEALVHRDGLRAFTMLDVGTGGGEIPRAVVAAAQRRGIEARAVGLDLDAHVVRYASAQDREFARDERSPASTSPSDEASPPRAQGLCVLQADAFTLPFPDGAFDFVTSSLMFHHFREAPASHLLAELARVARRAVVVNDLVRHRTPWLAITILSRFGRSRLVRHDGPLSVLRGWRPDELLGVAEAAGLSARARVTRQFPYRVVLVVERAQP